MMFAPLLSHVNGYHFHDIGLIAGLAIFIGLIPLAGLGVARIKNLKLARSLAWGLVIFSVAFVERFSVAEPSGMRMLLIIVALLWSMKSVVAVESLNGKSPIIGFRNWLAFVLFWFGMRPKLFATFSNQPKQDWKTYVARGLSRMALGAALYTAALALVYGPQSESATLPAWRLWGATACLMSGLSLFVHFGLFNLLVGFWRRQSLNCTPLFRAPLLSTSLTEFWGKRWNLAFSEMTSLAIFRPVKSWLGSSTVGTGVATAAAFLFSGLLHELAISVPVQAGFGLPLLYFLLHGVGMLIENSLERSGFDVLKRPSVGRLWTWLWIIVPLPILFHRPFLEGCVWPLVGIISS